MTEKAPDLPNTGAEEVGPEEGYLPKTPQYVIDRVERSLQAWEELSEKLGRPVTANLPQIAIGDAAREIASQIDAPIRIDVQSLTDSGVAADEVVSLQVDGISGAAAFKQLLEPYDLTTIIDGAVLAVTTVEVADETRIARIYPVSDLAIGFRNGRRESDMSQLVSLIHSTTSGPWEDIDGVGGTLTTYRRGGIHALAVRQTYAVHREIEDLLYELRETRPEAARRRITEPEKDLSGLRNSLREIRERIQRLEPAIKDLEVPALQERIESNFQELAPILGEEVREFLPQAEEPQPAGAVPQP